MKIEKKLSDEKLLIINQCTLENKSVSETSFIAISIYGKNGNYLDSVQIDKEKLRELLK